MRIAKLTRPGLISREIWISRWLADAGQDLRFAARLFRRSPGFTFIAALTLALGIGAGTAVFSIVNGVLLRPLPYEDPGRLVSVLDRGDRDENLAKLFASYADFQAIRQNARSFEDIAGITWATGASRILTGRGPARSILAAPATATFFRTLGARPMLGRTFNEHDDSAGCSVVLSHQFWRSALSGDPAVVGSALTLDRRSCTVLGVMPPAFAFYPEAEQMWMLLDPDFLPRREDVILFMVARLKRNVTFSQTRSEVQAIHEALHKADGREKDIVTAVALLHDDFSWLASRNLNTTLLLLSGAVAFLILIACVNVANLLLGRAAVRQHELAIRTALGCGRGRAIRQTLAEAALLSLVSAAFGGLLASAPVRCFQALNPIELPVGANVKIDVTALGFSILLSLFTAVLFGLAPALRLARVDLVADLKQGARSTFRQRAFGSWSPRWWPRVLVAGEVGVSVLLVTGASLLMNSVFRMESAKLGYDPERLLATTLAFPPDRYTRDVEKIRFYRDVLQRLADVPGGVDAALTSNLPPYGGGNQQLEIEGRPNGESHLHNVGGQAVSPGYFRVMKVSLLGGRLFSDHDDLASQPVAIVNDALARTYFSGKNPLGSRVRLNDGGTQGMPWLTVVGVAGNERHTSLLHEMAWEASPVVIRPIAQETQPSFSVVVRARDSQPAVAEAIRRTLGRLDPAVPVAEVDTVSLLLAKPLAYPRFRAALLGAFALCALVLAAVGLNGVLAQSVVQRTQEFGVRMAVGARPRDLAKLVAAESGVPVLSGLVAGIGASLLLGRLFGSLLYEVRPSDPATLLGTAVIMLMAAALAIAVPAKRAATIDPMAALRND
jgi:predicted permease